MDLRDLAAGENELFVIFEVQFGIGGELDRPVARNAAFVADGQRRTEGRQKARVGRKDNRPFRRVQIETEQGCVALVDEDRAVILENAGPLKLRGLQLETCIVLEVTVDGQRSFVEQGRGAGVHDGSGDGNSVVQVQLTLVFQPRLYPVAVQAQGARIAQDARPGDRRGIRIGEEADRSGDGRVADKLQDRTVLEGQPALRPLQTEGGQGEGFAFGDLDGPAAIDPDRAVIAFEFGIAPNQKRAVISDVEIGAGKRDRSVGRIERTGDCPGPGQDSQILDKTGQGPVIALDHPSGRVGQRPDARYLAGQRQGARIRKAGRRRQRRAVMHVQEAVIGHPAGKSGGHRAFDIDRAAGRIDHFNQDIVLIEAQSPGICQCPIAGNCRHRGGFETQETAVLRHFRIAVQLQSAALEVQGGRSLLEALEEAKIGGFALGDRDRTLVGDVDRAEHGFGRAGVAADVQDAVIADFVIVADVELTVGHVHIAGQRAAEQARGAGYGQAGQVHDGIAVADEQGQVDRRPCAPQLAVHAEGQITTGQFPAEGQAGRRLDAYRTLCFAARILQIGIEPVVVELQRSGIDQGPGTDNSRVPGIGQSGKGAFILPHTAQVDGGLIEEGEIGRQAVVQRHGPVRTDFQNAQRRYRDIDAVRILAQEFRVAVNDQATARFDGDIVGAGIVEQFRVAQIDRRADIDIVPLGEGHGAGGNQRSGTRNRPGDFAGAVDKNVFRRDDGGSRDFQFGTVDVQRPDGTVALQDQLAVVAALNRVIDRHAIRDRQGTVKDNQPIRAELRRSADGSDGRGSPAEGNRPRAGVLQNNRIGRNRCNAVREFVAPVLGILPGIVRRSGKGDGSVGRRGQRVRIQDQRRFAAGQGQVAFGR